ncbi:MAG: peptidoglycan-associated lipoprotein Pal [Pseudomonadota bacterium]
MTRTPLFIAPLVLLAACSQPDTSLNGPEFMAPSGSALSTSVAGTGLGTNPGVTASALAPNSPQYFSQTVGDRVLFDVDQYTLNATGRAALDGQAAWLLSNPSYQVTIEGHADEQGTREYNLALGARRAQAVQTYLLSKGVPRSRLGTVSFGKERPVEICSTETCYLKNRRAVTVLAGGVG